VEHPSGLRSGEEKMIVVDFAASERVAANSNSDWHWAGLRLVPMTWCSFSGRVSKWRLGAAFRGSLWRRRFGELLENFWRKTKRN